MRYCLESPSTRMAISDILKTYLLAPPTASRRQRQQVAEMLLPAPCSKVPANSESRLPETYDSTAPNGVARQIHFFITMGGMQYGSRTSFCAQITVLIRPVRLGKSTSVKLLHAVRG